MNPLPSRSENVFDSTSAVSLVFVSTSVMVWSQTMPMFLPVLTHALYIGPLGPTDSTTSFAASRVLAVNSFM